MSEPQIRNINTLTSEVNQDLYAYCHDAQKIELSISADFRAGFLAGTNALALRFIRAMEHDELTYTWKKKK